MLMYKVAGKGNNWVRGFESLDLACKYANRIFKRTGVIVAIETYQPIIQK